MELPKIHLPLSGSQRGYMPLLVAAFLLLLPAVYIHAQPTPSPHNYPAVNENKLADTKWRYAYTTYSGSNTPIHTADENYSHYIWLKFDYTFEQMLNGKRSYGMWALNDKKNKIYYKFKNAKWWDIVAFDDNKLVLEFADTQSSLQYTFERIPNDAAPFAKDKSLLPEVYVYDKINRKKPAVETRKTGFFAWIAEFFRGPEAIGKRAKDSSIVKPKYDPNRAPDPVPIEIVLIGGGYYGGIDPMIKNFIQIKTTGRVIHETETENGGAFKVKKDLTRQELESLARFIIDKKFFDFANNYDCEDGSCQTRKAQKPRPIPLRISVTYGDRKKTVGVAIWGKDGKGNRTRYIDYPPELDLIIENILLAANATNI